MNATRTYDGHDRREHDTALMELREHIDSRMDEHRAHFDMRFAEQSAKLEPLYEYYVMAKRGAGIVGWLAALAAGLAAAAAAIKGWIKL